MLRIKSQTDYYVTEVTFESPVDLREVQEVIRGARSSAKITGIYNNGGTIGVSVEQKTRVHDKESVKRIREILGIESEMI